jgi:hypothetical protein
MAESKGLYYGPQNRGLATILPSEAPNLFQMMDDLAAKRQEKEAEDAKKRGEEIAKAMEYNPSEVWQPYTEYSQNLYEKEYLDYAKKMYSGNRIPSQEEKFELQRRKNKVESFNDKINGYKESQTEFLKEVNKSPDMYNIGYIQEYIGQLHKSVEGGILNPSELDISMISNIKGDEKAYNDEWVLSSFDDMLAEETSANVESTPMGYIESHVEKKSGVTYKLDSNGEIERDPSTGRRLFEVSDAVFEKAMDYEYSRMKIQEVQNQAKESGEDITMREAFKRWYEPKTYMKEKKNRENNQFALAEYKNKLKGSGKQSEAEIFLNDLDRLINGAPEKIVTDTYPYYISNDGEVNEDGQGRPLIPVKTSLIDKQMGYDPENKTKVTITGVYKDQNTGSVYIKKSNKEELEPYNNENALSLLTDYDDFNKKDYASFAQQRGHVGTNNVFVSRLDKDVEKQKIEVQKQEQKDIESRLDNVRKGFEGISNRIKQGGKGEMWGYAPGEVEEINNTFKSIPQGVQVSIGGTRYENPEIKIVDTSTFFATKGSYHVYVDNEDTGVEATEENIMAILNGMKATPKAEVKDSEKAEKKETTEPEKLEW